MPYPFHILENTRVLGSAQDVETLIRFVLGRHLFQVERQNLDDTGKRFHLLFCFSWTLQDEFENDEQRKKYGIKPIHPVWGGAELIEWKNEETTITRMWHSIGADTWRSVFNQYDTNRERLVEEYFQYLEELSYEVRERFKVLDEKPNSQSAELTSTSKLERIDKENITLDELEKRIMAGDKEAIELEEELSKELQQLLKEAAVAIKQLAFTPLELAVYETFVKKDPTAIVAIRKMTLGELKSLLPEIVHAQQITAPKLVGKSGVKPEIQKQRGRYRLTDHEIKFRRQKVKEAKKIKKDNPQKQWKEIDKQFAEELNISDRTFRSWRHNNY